MTAHAILSPSSADRWIHCPPSALINAEAPQTDTVFTREGTLAHAVCELKGRKYFLSGIGSRKYIAELKKLKADELWQDEMELHTETWLNALKDIAAEYTSPPYVALEQRVDFSEYVPGGFGTADALMIGSVYGVEGDVLNVVDFKYGRGVPVSAEDNPQLKLYALGALLDYMAIYDIFTVRITIVQPRLREERDTWELPARDLLKWAEEVVKPAAQLAAKGEGEFREGDWCRWCAIRGSCRARADANLALVEKDFAPPATLDDEEIGEALEQGRRLAKWLSDLEDYALAACLEGREIAGWKAAEGRSVRAWIDQDAALDAARAAGIPDEMLWERKPITLAGVEKLMGRRQFLDVMAPYVTAPPGKPTLVPIDDKRKPITRITVEEDFKEDN